MSISMNKICDKLYLGNLKAASDLSNLKKNGITHILQVASGIQPFFPNDLKYKVINVLDNSNQSLLRHFPAAIAFIKDGVLRGGGVLVHCYAGVSRSSTCVIAYLMQERELSFEDAFSFASKRRPVIFPNMGFQRQLTEFERLLSVKRQHTVPKQLNNQIMHQVNQGLTHNQNRNQKHKGTIIGELNRRAKYQYQSIYNASPNQLQRVQENANDFHPQENEFEYDRLKHFERSASFGFNEDALGRLTEINKEQMHEAIRGLNANLRRTNSNFYRPNQNQIQKSQINQGFQKDPFNTSVRNQNVRQSSVNKSKPISQTSSSRNIKNDLNMKGSQDYLKHKKHPNTGKNISVKVSNIKILNKDPFFDPYSESTNQNSALIKDPPVGGYLNAQFINTSGQRGDSSKQSNGRPMTQNSKKQMYSIPNNKQSIGNLHQKQSNLNSPNRKKVKFSGRIKYDCNSCGISLFTNNDLLDAHQMGQIGVNSTSSLSSMNQIPTVNGHRSTLTKCACLYLQCTDWMIHQGVNKNTNGPLFCLNSSCNAKLGQYSINGLKCNCGQMISPAYQIYKSKVKCQNPMLQNGYENTHYGQQSQNTIALMSQTFHENQQNKRNLAVTNDPFITRTQNSNIQDKKLSIGKSQLDHQKLQKVNNQVQFLIKGQIQKPTNLQSSEEYMNVKMLENNKKQFQAGGQQAYKILNRGNGDFFDVSQTYIGKDKNGGKHGGSRYISVNKEVSDSYNHHMNMENMKTNNTPLQNYSKSPQLTGAGNLALLNTSKHMYIKQNIHKKQSSVQANNGLQMQINGINYENYDSKSKAKSKVQSRR